MAKTSSIYRNKKRQKMAAQFAEKRAKLKAIAKDKTVPQEDRFLARLKLAELPRNSSKVRIRNRCAVTGRSRGVESRFQMCRIVLRDLASRGQIPGMVKSSW
ncbi:MAG: 30S ribosomal protein S14 [Alphaproteobacteria bacterium]|nr:30S ribosomal protein S14 [Alphaproteobacteria bacterium]